MKYSRLGIFLLSLVLLPLALNNLWRISAGALGNASYVSFSGDEVFVVNAAKYVYQDGYFGMRCRKGHTGSCYGGTQIFFDGFALKLLPKSWLEKDAVVKTTAVDWPPLQTYPNLLKALRIIRAIHAYFLVALIGAVGLYLGGDLLLGWLLMLGLASSPIFSVAWQGAKNDFISAITEIIFVLLLMRMFRQPRRGEFLCAILFGVAAVFVRPILLPMLAFSFLAYAWLRRENIWALAKDLLLAGDAC